MEKEFIPYEQALKLKELGFDEDCIYDYFAFNNLNQTLEDDVKPMLTQEDVDIYCAENKLYPFWSCAAPLYQQAFRWFREKYNLICKIDIYSYSHTETNFEYDISNKENTISEYSTIHKSYEEAEFECLKKLIEIIKNK